ncbi:MAG: ABC transporter ATP-binding protein [Streptosporangiales bacterium]|nr:ABC transporter ATP-binding protein [Streptosporangiales bacterium]
MESVSKVYGRGSRAVTALRQVSVTISCGSFTAVMGPSGSGKSTFLQCAAGLDSPSSGRVILGGTDLSGMNEDRLARLRRERAGFVFQSYNLMPSLTVTENITLPLRLAGKRADRTWLREVIARTGLADRVRHRPAQLSGGQQQRVAIARALVTRPDVIFADEPTGALDIRTAREILGLLRQAAAEANQAVVMVTHDPMAASYADTVVFLADGEIAGTAAAASQDQIAGRMARLEADR